MAADFELLDRARAGDHAAYDELVAPHRAALLAHTYRMLGSFQDAEDVVQDSLLAAWLALPGFEGRSSLRTWLFRITTHRCLNHVRTRASRVQTVGPAPIAPPSTTGEAPWLQPFPDAALEAIEDPAPGPEARYESREAISLAFVTAMQALPPTQRAVLLLRDVLGYRARETAELLDLSTAAVTSALNRARANLQSRRALEPNRPLSAQDDDLVRRFVDAFTAEDPAAVVALMTDDVWISMPPLPFEYVGMQAATSFLAAVGPHRRTIQRMEPVGINRQPAWGEYVGDSHGDQLHLAGILAVQLRDGLVCELTHFEAALGPLLCLPRTLPCT